MSNARHIEFVDGPLAGDAHELQAGFPMPDRIRYEDVKNRVGHWYLIQEGNKGYFEKSEALHPDRDDTPEVSGAAGPDPRRIYKLKEPLEKLECWNRTDGSTGSFAAGEQIRIDTVHDEDRMVIVCPDDEDGRPLTNPDGTPDPHPGYRFIATNAALSKAIGVKLPSKNFDLVSRITEWEEGEMSDEDEVEFFQHLIDTGMAWRFQGCYGRRATQLIREGKCQAPKGG